MRMPFLAAFLLSASVAAAAAPVNLVCTDQKQGGALRWQVDTEAQTVTYLGKQPPGVQITIKVVEISPTRVIWEERSSGLPFVDRYVVQRDTLGMIKSVTMPGRSLDRPHEVYQCEIAKENKF